jgi:hypothetical protein
MHKTLGRAWLWSILLQASAAVLGGSQSGPLENHPVISVLTYNYAKVSAGLLARAKAEASRAFRRVGIQTELPDCPGPAAEAREYPACHAGTRSTLLVVSIIPRTMAVPGLDSPLELGAALLDNPHPFASYAYVFFDRVKQRAEIKNCDLAILLGYAMAHEIGHLLLGPEAHSSKGIMSPAWSKTELDQAQTGELNFTPAQAEKMRIQINRRTLLATSTN